ncbi:hypothetical protein MCOR25_010704 [Pyricularia grisea]|uniref:Peptidase A1 domain-containing protein n=1 Tax=Pyricularia grisea TaxID=148305 RepID=A0A6P8B571_PYRGI|nr:hypothetical protein PgNI_05146 [Pyricularia grisea]KAI6349090.1 hypothetical protein MCOR25_010704 [Pyricularia grisea]TLD10274.1 hypothetical protein PgNI_05146 [Pyricularia grisea]
MLAFMQTLILLTTLSAAVISASSVSVFRYDPPTRSGPLSMYKTRAKYGVPISPELSAAVRRAGFNIHNLNKRQQQKQQGNVSAFPYRGDSEWLNQVKLGTPPQVVNLQLDTGSAELWVFADKHPTANKAGRRVYSPSKSSTAARMPGLSWEKSYAGGNSASGTEVYNDTVRLGDIVAQSQAILPATAASESYVKSPYDGILGLELANFTATLPVKAQGPTNFFETIKSSLPSPLFGVDLKQDNESFFDFGVVPTNRYRGEVGWTPVNPSRVKGMDYSRWNMTASGYAIGDSKTVPLKARNMTGVVDTGTTLLYLDKPIVEEYYGKVPGSRYDPLLAGWVFPCGIAQPLPDFSFGVGPVGSAVTITIPGTYLNWTEDAQAKIDCFGGIQESIDLEGSKVSIFGTVAIKSAYVIFEDARPAANPRVGWAAKDL